ncbi:MAG: recombinase family protein [Anaerolineales bacterium]|nr:recombinase family protein [Anaerolineales bacterium]
MKTLDKTQQNIVKRAVIYVRVSTEKQAEKVSPEAQEQDGRAYCEKQGYIVIAVYRDIEKYRSGKKLVEPSGTRRDRPKFKQMLADGYGGKFDVIIAWREDRLYRGLRPMMDVLDCLKETEVEIELVKETFDKNFAPVKAWVANMELEGRRERTTMGMKGRLAQGKISGGSSAVPYGYDYHEDTGTYTINKYEADWVRNIWQWYSEGVAIHEIRRRLINAAVPQKGNKPRKYSWHTNIIRQILKREDYFTGIFISKWAGQAFEIEIPPILDKQLFEAVRKQQARWKNYPAGKTKQTNLSGQPVHPVYALAPGVIYCAACGVKMRVVRYKKRNSKGILTGKYYDYYRCNNLAHLCSLSGCAGLKRIQKTDAEIWEKIWPLLSKPGALEKALEARISELQAQESNAETDCQYLEQELQNLFLERQKVVTWARKELITEDDLQVQLFSLSQQEKSLKRYLTDARLLVGNRAERLLQVVKLYREKTIIGYEVVNQNGNTPEQTAAIFEARRRIIEGLVTKVEVMEDGSVKVEAEIHLDESKKNKEHDSGIYIEDIDLGVK